MLELPVARFEWRDHTCWRAFSWRMEILLVNVVFLLMVEPSLQSKASREVGACVFESGFC